MNGTTCRPSGLRIHQRVRAGVGTAGGENAGHAMLPEQRQHLVELVVGLRFPIVMQMRVEDFDRLGREHAIARRGQHSAMAIPMRRQRPAANRIALPASLLGRDDVRPLDARGLVGLRFEAALQAAVDPVEIDVDHRRDEQRQ